MRGTQPLSLFYLFLRQRLTVLPVTPHRPAGHDAGDGGKGTQLVGDVAEIAASDENRTDGIDKVMHGIDVGGEIGQVGHRTHGGEESAEQEHAHHEKPHHEHRLLHRIAVVRNNEAETAPENGEQHGKDKDKPRRTLAGDAVEDPRQKQTDHLD